jgi:hypothetical protein
LGSRCVSTLRQLDHAATVRCNFQITIVSSNRTTPQVDQVPHTEPVADLTQRRAAGRKETAQLAISAYPRGIRFGSKCFIEFGSTK